MTLAERIIGIAKERNISFAELGRIAGIERTTISMITTGKSEGGNPTIKKLVEAFGDEFEQYYQYATCKQCGEVFLPANGNQATCSKKCSKKNATEISVRWSKSHSTRTVSGLTDSQRFGWGPKVKKPAVSIPEYNSVAREEYGSYGQRGAAERVAQSGTMRESMGLV